MKNIIMMALVCGNIVASPPNDRMFIRKNSCTPCKDHSDKHTKKEDVKNKDTKNQNTEDKNEQNKRVN